MVAVLVIDVKRRTHEQILQSEGLKALSPGHRPGESPSHRYQPERLGETRNRGAGVFDNSLRIYPARLREESESRIQVASLKETTIRQTAKMQAIQVVETSRFIISTYGDSIPQVPSGKALATSAIFTGF